MTYNEASTCKPVYYLFNSDKKQTLTMKAYVPDPEKWVRYFESVAARKTQGVVQIKPASRIIPIEDVRPVAAKNTDVVRIEAITPLQQLDARVKSELSRNKKRKSSSNTDVEQTGGSGMIQTPRRKRRVARLDVSGF